MPGLIFNYIPTSSPGKLSLDVNIVIRFLGSPGFFYIAVFMNTQL